MSKGVPSEMEILKGVFEEEFYFLLQNHEKRVEIEAKYPRMSLF
ncbi:hypothetical protein [Gaetbulibacter sp. PBL-D1]